MNNTYFIIKEDLKTALDHIESFEEKMISFSEKYPRYVHSVKLDKNKEDMWEIEIQIRTKDEPVNINAS